MTQSEIHAVMTGGFATIAGSVMGAFILFGVRPLLCCAIMVHVFIEYNITEYNITNR